MVSSSPSVWSAYVPLCLSCRRPRSRAEEPAVLGERLRAELRAEEIGEGHLGLRGHRGSTSAAMCSAQRQRSPSFFDAFQLSGST